MKRKKNNKLSSPEKNAYILLRLYYGKKYFLTPIIKWRVDLFGIKEAKNISFIWEKDEFYRLPGLTKKHESFIQTLHRYPLVKKLINNDIQKIRLANKLGIEWERPILFFITTGMGTFPGYNLMIESSIHKKNILIHINGRTSLKDIEEAWPEIKRKQKEVFGTVKRINVTTSTYKRFRETMTMLNEKISHPLRERNPENNKNKQKKTTDEDIVTRVFEIASIKKASKKVGTFRTRLSRLNRGISK
ncbi:hypothetical protein ACFL04_04700 [Patescibacteria group bacterium]